MSRPRVFVGMGGNEGEPRAAFRRSLEFLRERGVALVAHSAASLTAAHRTPEQQQEVPAYWNAVVEVDTREDAPSLLKLLHTIEDSFGRVRTVRWGSRTLDLDLLAYGEERRADPQIILPHPRIASRGFVLGPWREVSPEFVVPGTGQSVSQLYDALSVSERQVLAYDPHWLSARSSAGSNDAGGW